MARVVPIVHVYDIDEALAFYTDVLECEVDFVGRGDDGVAFHSGVTFRGAPLMIGWRANLPKDERDREPGGIIVQFDVEDDIDGYYARVCRHDVQLVRAIDDRYWGQKSFEILDPFGYHLSFAMNLPEQT